MNRLVALALSACMMTLLAACGDGHTEISSDAENAAVSAAEDQREAGGEIEAPETSASADEADDEPADSDRTSSGSSILVAYFSCTGTTERIAQWIVDETSADSYQIIPETPYAEDDLNYNDSSSRANQEQADASARPAISGSVEHMEQYDVIFLGYPIWHGQVPRIISTFLERYEFSDVTIIPFCTSHSSGIGSSAENLHSLCAGTVAWMDGQRFSGDATENEVDKWTGGLALPKEDSEVTPLKMNVQIGDSVFTATLEENDAVNALVAMMEEAPVVVEMSDYSGFEKVGSLGASLPADDSLTITQAGDIVLYCGDQIVIFYGSNSWSCTRLGHIDDLTGWEEALGSGDVTVTFSLD
ncbi:MAG: hypothetical protein LUF81_07260 [Clostridiales bacterium]|nr:hypothetical protein [Clostridiales bacterium]